MASAPSSRAHARRGVELAAAAALLLAALALRALVIGRGHQLDIDEADTALKVAKPVSTLIAELTRDGHPPIYFLLLKGWTSLFGRSEIALRSLSALLSGGTLLVLLHAARAMFGPAAALYAGVLFVVSPIEIFHATEGRMYTLLPLIALAALCVTSRLFEEPGRARRHASWLFLLLVAGLYTHNYGLFLPAALAAAALVRAARLRSVGSLVIPFAVAIASYLAYLPWLPILQGQRASKAHVWLIGFFEAIPPIMAIPRSLAALAGVGPYPPITPPLRQAAPFWPIMLPIALGLLALGVHHALAPATRRRRGAPEEPTRHGRLALPIFCAAVLGLPWLVSVTLKVVYLVGRYDVIALPMLLILLGAGAARLVRLHRALVLFPLILLLSPLPAVRALLAQPPGGGVVDQVAHIASFPESRALIATQLCGSRIRYYLARASRNDIVVQSFPSSTDDHPGWFERPDPRDPQIIADAEAEMLDFAARLQPGELLWATLYDNDETKELLVNALARHFVPVPGATRLPMGLIAVTEETAGEAAPPQ